VTLVASRLIKLVDVTVDGATSGTWNITAPDIEWRNNRFPSATLATIKSGRVYHTRLSDNLTVIASASASPTKGVWGLGDRIQNTVGTIGQPRGWITSTAGGAKSTTRADATPYTATTWIAWSTGTTVWECTTAGTSTTGAPSIVGKVVGDTVTDGTVVWTCRSLTTAAFTSEGNL
jgi:hypothetical protein